MGVVVHKETERNTELNDRIAADLRNRARESSQISDPDLIEDSDYVKNMQQTRRFGWIWIVLIAGAIISLILIINI